MDVKNLEYQNPRVIVDINGLDIRGCLFKNIRQVINISFYI